MNVDEATKENLTYMFEKLQTRLQVVNPAILDATGYSLHDYNDIKEIYEYVIENQNISVKEMDAIVSELGKIKVRNT